MESRLPRSYNGYDFKAASDEVGLACLDPSLTQESEALDTDINEIVRRFGITGQLPARDSIPLVTNDDFVGATDFQTVMALQIEAKKAFAAMPADVRGRFDNDPVKFVNFCSGTDEATADELVRLGIAVKRKKEEPAPAAPAAVKA